MNVNYGKSFLHESYVNHNADNTDVTMSEIRRLERKRQLLDHAIENLQYELDRLGLYGDVIGTGENAPKSVRILSNRVRDLERDVSLIEEGLGIHRSWSVEWETH